MKRTVAVSAIGIMIAAALISLMSSCKQAPPPASQVERGAYLVMAAGCNDCHTPKMMTAKGPVFDTSKTLSGHQGGSQLPPIPAGLIGPASWGTVANNDLTAWAGPWGVSFAYNLTPDEATGIGLWDETMFIDVLRTGKFMGVSRDILPPMPWQGIGRMTDDDLKAIFAYMKSLPPIKNPIPVPLTPDQIAVASAKDGK